MVSKTRWAATRRAATLGVGLLSGSAAPAQQHSYAACGQP